MPLNINWQQILLHLFNFLLLFGILYSLIYKPVTQFMAKRRKHYEDMDEKAKANLAEAEKSKEEYLNKLKAADEEILEEKKNALKAVEKASAVKVKETEKEVEKMIADARKDIENERKMMMKEARNEIVNMVSDVADRLAVESKTSDTYDLFLDSMEGSDTDA